VVRQFRDSGDGKIGHESRRMVNEHIARFAISHESDDENGKGLVTLIIIQNVIEGPKVESLADASV